MGAFQGELRNFAAPELGAAAIRAAVERAKVRPEEIDEVIMDCVLPAGQGQAPARQASLGAGLPLATGCTTPIAIKAGKEEKFVELDEQPFKANLDKISTLKPAFRKDGTVTAANSSSISDGAAALVMMRRSAAEKRGLAPLATVVGHATHSQEPAWFTTAPVGAMRKLLEKTGWNPNAVDLYEINEAFAVVTMAAMKEHGLPHDKVNVHGGACALGHRSAPRARASW